MLPDIDLLRIRPLEGSRNKGFEELCVQLFRSTFPAKTRFYRVNDAGGDGGVEDIALIEQKKKIGLQAKFFEKLGQSQWSQINKSVRTALQAHCPDLVEYRIASPCNRSKDSKTWYNYCVKWQEFARTLGYAKEVDFIWLGDTELRSDLTKTEHHDKVYYWFGCRKFTHEWLEEHFRITRQLLDTRYTPKHHVRTESEKTLDAFFLTDGFENAFWRLIRKVASCAIEAFDMIKNGPASKELQSLAEEIERFRSTFSENSGVVPISICRNSFQQLKDRTLDVYRRYEGLREEEEAKPHGSDKRYSPRPYSYELGRLEKFLSTLYEVDEFIARFKSYDTHRVLILGNAGTGKSHLLAASVENSLARGQPAVLLLGEQFSSAETPLAQACRILGWEDGIESLLGALNTVAAVKGKPAIIAIDALNESEERKLWKSHLLQAAAQITQYCNLRIMVSCRSDFAPLMLPKSLMEGRGHEWTEIEHQGFSEEVFEAVAMFFNGYNVKCDHFPPVLEEFRIPLFLKTFCEAYANDSVPPGPLSLDQILKKRVKKCQELIRDAIDCPEYKTKQAIDLLASKIAENHGQAIPYDEIRPEIDRLFDGGGESRSLYTQLRSNGMIAETLRFKSKNTDDPETVVRFPYERFLDYFVASRLLDNYATVDQLKAGWRTDGLPDKWIEDYRALYDNRGLLRMLAILVPDRFECEFIDLFRSDRLLTELCGDFLSSLPWRTADTITHHTEDLFHWCARNMGYPAFLEERLRLITIPNHPLNARRLHTRLSQARLWERELHWTIPISKMTSSGDGNVINDILRWTFSVPSSLVSDEQAWLAALFLTWLLTSNYRFLRQRASRALIHMLIGRAHLAAKLVEEFHDCNDPYVVERVYAAACGVALREIDKEALGLLASAVFKHMFAGGRVPPHVLQRDYAQLIIECANYCGALPEGVELEHCGPNYHSRWPRIVTEDKARKIEEQDGWFEIRHSLQPEGSGMYGDFGRYVMDAKIHRFSRRTLKQLPQANSTWKSRFSGFVARRYILQRIMQLGWTSERFSDYEKDLRHGRMRFDEEENKVERISKKYQWIALRELLGYLSDHYRMPREWSTDMEPEFKGAWQIWARDFDPTQPLQDPQEQFDLMTDNELPPVEDTKWWITYPDPFEDFQLRFDRERWVMAAPPGFEPLIEQPNVPEQQGEWLTLSCHYSWNEELTIAQDEKKEGQLKMWADLRCWLIRKEHKKHFLEQIDKLEFWGHGVDYPGFHIQWLGEYPWAPSMKEIKEACSSKDEWVRDVDVDMIQTVCGYSNERSGISARLPGPIVCEFLNLRWTGKSFEYVDSSGASLAFCPGDKKGLATFSSPLLVKKERFLAAFGQAGFTAVWAALSERSCYSYKKQDSIVKRWGITQRVYGFENGCLVCYGDKQYEIPHGN